MSQARRVAVNTGFLYARLGLTMFVSLYSTRLILNALGAMDFGLFNVIAGSIAMLTFLNNGLTRASLRFMSFAQGEGQLKKQRDIFNISVVLHLIVGLIVVILLEAVGYFLFDGILTIDPARTEVAKLIFQFMIVSTFFTILAVPYDAVINARENMLLIAVVGVIQAVLKLGLALYITYTSYDKLIMYGLGMALLAVFVLVLQAVYCHIKYNEVRINFQRHFDRILFKNMTSFAGWGLLGGSTSMLANYGQGIVLNSFFGTVANAAQGISNQVSAQLGNLATAMQKALNPAISKNEGAGNREMMLRVSIMGSKLSFFLLMILYVPMIIEMDYIFKIWLKNVPEYAVIFCKLLFLRRLIEQIYLTINSTVEAVGDVRLFHVYKSVLNVFPLIIAYFLFTFGFQPHSIYIVFVGYAIIDGVISLYFAKVKCGLAIPEYLRNVALRCFASFFIVLVVSSLPTLIMPEGLLRLLIVVGISSLLFLIVVGFIGFNQEEQKSIQRFLLFLVNKVKPMFGLTFF